MNKYSYGKQSIDTSDIEAVQKVLTADYLTQGPEVEKFEQDLAKYTGAKYAVVMNSGTAALHAAYYACGLTHNDKFITTPMTFAATANAGLYLGAQPIFVDIDPKTGNINPDIIENKITNHTRLLSVVHYAGHPVEMNRVWEIAEKYKLAVVEDACHALGAEYKNKKIGSSSRSKVVALSFHPVKHITTGEGGAVLTNYHDIYLKIKQFMTHGITKEPNNLVNKNVGPWYHEMQFLGFNYRMPDILAALGRSQLKRIELFINKRREIAQQYNLLFKDNIFFDLPEEKNGVRHAYHLYPIKLKEKYWKIKKQIVENLQQCGIGVQVHYIPVYQHPFYKTNLKNLENLPNAEKFYNSEISLPIYPNLSSTDVIKISKIILKTLKKYE